MTTQLTLAERISGARNNSFRNESNDLIWDAILADVRELERCVDRLDWLCDQHISLSKDEARRLIEISAWGRLAYFPEDKRIVMPDRKNAIYSAIDAAILTKCAGNESKETAS